MVLGIVVCAITAGAPLHFRELIFKLHRLQHEMRIFQHPFSAFRNDEGKTTTLCESGKFFQRDGQFADADPDSRERSD